MEPKQLENLPIVFQIIAGLGLFFGTFMLAVGGWFWKVLRPKLPEALQAVEPAAAIPINSAQILDTATFEKLSRSIGEMVEFLRHKDDDEERELQRGFGNLDKTMQDLLKEAERITKCLERVEKQISERTLI